MSPLRLVIIGNGAAALSALEAIRGSGESASLTLITDEDCSAYSRVLLSYYISSEVEEKDLFLRDERYYMENKINILRKERVCRLDTKSKIIHLSSGKKVSYKRLLIATGSHPILPSARGNDLSGISTLHDKPDAERIISWKKNARRTLVIGGGLIGVKSAEALAKCGLEVTIIEKENRILPQMLDIQSVHIVERHLRDSGIRVKCGSSIREFMGSHGAVEGVRLEDGRKLYAELVIVGIGVRPDIDFLKGSGIKVNQGILVNENQQTSVPDVYAAGDVAETKDFFTGEYCLSAVWPAAVVQGGIAGLNMVGRQVEYSGSVRMNVVDVCGLAIASIGCNSWYGISKTIPTTAHRASFRTENRTKFCNGEPKAIFLHEKGNGIEVIRYSEGNSYRALVFQKTPVSQTKKRLIGVSMVGDIQDAGIMHYLIRNKSEFDEPRNIFSRQTLKWARLMKTPGFSFVNVEPFAPVAQLERVMDFESRGCQFKSGRARGMKVI